MSSNTYGGAPGGYGGAAPAPREPNLADSIIKESRRAHKLAGDVTRDGGAEQWAVPDGYKVETVLAHDAHAHDPERHKGTVKLATLDSFVAYLNTFKMGENSRVYCAADFGAGTAHYVGVLNDHGADGADYQDFRALYTPQTSPEWKLWTTNNKQVKSQAQFAAFIEENLRDITPADGYPTGSDMLQMAVNLEINQDARFRNVIRLQSGSVNLSYLASPDDQTEKTMGVFERFALGIPPFLGGATYRVDARLRYRLKDGAVSFWYELMRPDLIVADAVKAEVAKIAEETKLLVLMGALA